MMMLKKVIYVDGLISQIPASYNRGYHPADTFPAHHCEVIATFSGLPTTLETMLVRLRCHDKYDDEYYGGYYLGYNHNPMGTGLQP